VETGEFLAPNSDQADRIVTGQSATSNGWAVDQLALPVVWGWYGYDGGTATTNHDVNDPAYVTQGSNSLPAVLFDVPSGWGPNTWFEAVDVPVCLDPESRCVNSLLGYYYWLFTVATDGSDSTPFSEIGVDWMQDAVDAAVAKWNQTAPALGKHPFPNLTRM